MGRLLVMEVLVLLEEMMEGDALLTAEELTRELEVSEALLVEEDVPLIPEAELDEVGKEVLEVLLVLLDKTPDEDEPLVEGVNMELLKEGEEVPVAVVPIEDDET